MINDYLFDFPLPECPFKDVYDETCRQCLMGITIHCHEYAQLVREIYINYKKGVNYG